MTALLRSGHLPAMKKEEARPVRVLLVDDNVHGLTARKMILLDHGYEVETAQSGEEAWEIFQIHQFDVVPVDARAHSSSCAPGARAVGVHFYVSVSVRVRA